MTTKQQLLKAQYDEFGYNFCERCKKNRGHMFRLDEHHIIYRSEKPNHSEIENKLNKILVCNECHDWYHDIKSRRAHLIEERNLVELFGNSILNFK